MDTAITSSICWFQNRSIDVKDNLLVYVSRNTLFLYTIKEDGHVSFENTITGHQEKVNGCRFCHAAGGGDLLATYDEGGFVRLWNVVLSKNIKIYQTHGKTKVNSLDWSRVNKDLIVSVDEKGMMVVYHYSDNKAVRYYPENSANVLQMVTCSPFNEDLVCVGYKTGSVSVVNIKGRCSVVMKFRGHNSEIQDIYWPEIMFTGDDINEIIENSDQWQPSARSSRRPSQSLPPTSQPQDHSRRANHDSEMRSDIIVTCCKDKNIRLWCVKTGQFIRMLRTPTKVYQGKRPNDEYHRLYLQVYWPVNHKFKLLSTGYNGEIIVWDLTKPFKDRLQMTAVGGSDIDSSHRRTVINLCPGKNPDTIYSASVDRTLKCWNNVFETPHERPAWTLPTVGGYVHKIQVCPTDPTLLAFGSGDGTIRIWQTSNPHDRYDMITCYQKIRDKISAIAWHPTKADVIAFGTEDGKVGCFNLNDPDVPCLSCTYHLKVVYCLRWGPYCYSKEGEAATGPKDNSLCLFSAGGDGVLLMHQSSIATNRPRSDQNWTERAVEGSKIVDMIKDANPDFDERYQKYAVTEFAWSHNFKFLAVGDYRGMCLIFSAPHLQQLIEISSVYHFMINTIEWGPPIDEKSSFWLATGSKEELVAVFDLQSHLSAIDDSTPPPAEVVVIKQATRSLVGHKNRITTLSWSPRQAGFLASGSFDGSVQIWNVYQDTPVANYRKHTSRVLTVCWTQIRANNGEGEEMLFSGGEDYSLHSWCYSKLEHKLPAKEPPPWCLPQGQFRKIRIQQKRNTLDKVKETGVVEIMNDEIQDVDASTMLERKKKELLTALEETSTSRDDDNCAEENGATPAATRDHNRKEFYEAALADGRNLYASGLKVELPLEKRPSTLIEDPHQFQARLKRPRTICRLAAKTEGDVPKVTKKLRNSLMARIKEKDQKSGVLSSQAAEPQSQDEKSESTAPQKKEKVEPFLFGPRKNMISALENEGEHILMNPSAQQSYHAYYLFESYAAMKLWSGDVVGLIDEAILRKKLNDQILNYAITVSYDLWLKAVKAYAEQLFEEKHFLRSSNYYLACNMVEQAVKALIDGGLYREALILARIRFGDDSEITKYASTAFSKDNRGSISLQSAVSLITGDVDGSTERLRTGMYKKNKRADRELNIEYGILSFLTCRLDDEVSEKKLVNYTNDCLNECCGYDVRWKTAHQIAEQNGLYVLSFRLIVSAHELLVNILNMSDEERKSYFTEAYEEQSSLLFENRTKTDSFNEQFQAVLPTVVKVDGYDEAHIVKVVISDMDKFMQNSHEIYNDNLTFRQILVQMAACLTAVNLHRFYKLNKPEVEENIKNLLIKFSKHQSFIEELQENVVDVYDGVENTKTYPARLAPIQQASKLQEQPAAVSTETPTENSAETSATVSTETPTENSAETSATVSTVTPTETLTAISAEASVEAPTANGTDDTKDEASVSKNGEEATKQVDEVATTKQVNGHKPDIKGNVVTFSNEIESTTDCATIQSCAQTLDSSTTESSTQDDDADDDDEELDQNKCEGGSEKRGLHNGIASVEKDIKANGTNGHHHASNGGDHQEVVGSAETTNVVGGTSGQLVSPTIEGCKLNGEVDTNGTAEVTATNTNSIMCQQT